MKNVNLRKCVAENLRACQLRQVELLEVVKNICEKHKLIYWLDGGTLLGAVRHQGFIPWDDDLDIVMPQEDLKKFIRVAPQELPEDIFLQTRETDPSTPYQFTKLRDMNSLFIEFRDDFQKDYQKGIYLDIFAFEPYPTLPRAITKFITRRINKSYAILHAKHYYSLRSAVELFWFAAMYISMNSLWKLLRLFCKKDCYQSYAGVTNGCGVMQHKDHIYPLKQISFEGQLFNAPADPDAYLKVHYNDYMTLPPVEERKIHAVYINPGLYEKE